MLIKLDLSEHGRFRIETAGAKTNRPSSTDLKAILRYTGTSDKGGGEFNALMSNFGTRAAKMDPQDRPIAKRDMSEEIDWLEELAYRHRHPRLFQISARMLEAFSSWFCHISLGEDKFPPLQRALTLLSEQYLCDPTDPTPLITSAGMRIGLPQVRDLNEARRLLDLASSASKLTKQQRKHITDSYERLDKKTKSKRQN